MSGFEVSGTNVRDSALFASAPEGEPTFVFVMDDSSDGKDSSLVVTATLDWVRGEFYDFIHDSRIDRPVGHLAAYIKLPGDKFITPCTLDTPSRENPGDHHRIKVSDGKGRIHIYDI